MARRGPPLTRDQATFTLALALHAALWLAVRGFAVHGVVESAPPDTLGARAASIEVDLLDATPEAPSSADASERHAMSQTASARGARATARQEPAPTPSPETVPDQASVEQPASPIGSPPRVAVNQPIDLGLSPDGWQRWVLATPPDRLATARREPRAPLVRAPAASRTGGLQEGLEARDQELGLGPAGRVATALYLAAHDDAAPQTGAARFNVTVYRTGAVEISLDDPKDARWRKIAERAAEELRRSPPRVPPSREGYRLTLKLTAEEVMPNGTKRGDLRAPRLEASAPRFQSTTEGAKELERLNPTVGVGPDQDLRERRAVTKLPGIYVMQRGKVCESRVGVTPLGAKDKNRVSWASLDVQGECDPVNAGAKFQRLVRTEVEAQTAF